MEKHHAAGLRLIENILEDKNWNVLLENNISDSDFLGDAAIVLKYVRDYFTNYSQFPDKEIVEEETLITFPKKVPLEHSLKSFKNYQLSKKLSEVTQETSKYLVRGDAESAYSYILSNILEISPPSKIKGFKETAQERFENYKKKKMEGVKGIVPPWPSLAEAIVAWERGTLNAILGVSGTGKSWSAAVASYFAAFEQNAQVLLVTMENSKESMESRLDALYTKIPFGDMRQGWVDLRHEQRWQQHIQEMPEKQGDIIVVSGKKVRTVADIVQLSNSYNPSFVVVDGAYKLTGQGKEMWEKSSNVLESLHHAAEMSKAAWLATSQLNPAAEKAKGGMETAYNARGNKNWVTDPATVMTLTQTPDQRILNHVECRIAKIREAGDVADMNMTFLMLQDRTAMRFEEVIDEYLNEDILNSIIS